MDSLKHEPPEILQDKKVSNQVCLRGSYLVIPSVHACIKGPDKFYSQGLSLNVTYYILNLFEPFTYLF